MLSTPYHKLLMRLSDPDSASWASRAIGDQESEDMRKGRTRGGRESSNASTEVRTRPAVLPSEIQNLPDGWGFLKIPGMCVKLQFPYIPPKAVAPGLVPSEPEVRPAPVAVTEEAEKMALPEWGKGGES
jgi:hypothetical protein